MVLKGQRPPHPGASAELRGLDLRLWRLCRACWSANLSERPSLSSFNEEVARTRDNVLVCPVNWTVERLEGWVKPRIRDLSRRIAKFQSVARRDVSGENPELKAVLRTGFRTSVEVKLWSTLYLRRWAVQRLEVCDVQQISAVTTDSMVGSARRVHDVVSASAPQHHSIAWVLHTRGRFQACRTMDVLGFLLRLSEGNPLRQSA